MQTGHHHAYSYMSAHRQRGHVSPIGCQKRCRCFARSRLAQPSGSPLKGQASILGSSSACQAKTMCNGCWGCMHRRHHVHRLCNARHYRGWISILRKIQILWFNLPAGPSTTSCKLIKVFFFATKGLLPSTTAAHSFFSLRHHRASIWKE